MFKFKLFIWIKNYILLILSFNYKTDNIPEKKQWEIFNFDLLFDLEYGIILYTSR